ncbi:hypothetical protein LCGC14_1568150 [marine sediment metagenome]|uniref:Uncharacterized protein n=1 Tax=marine sediment metagenome TaxID=412755 RepID=A0A0F9IKG6_9ZZZZ
MKRIRGYRKGSTIHISGRAFKVSYEDGFDGSTMYLTSENITTSESIIIKVECETQNLYQQGMGPMGSGGRQEDFYSVSFSVDGNDFQEYGKVSYLPKAFEGIVN